jgi:hypothetical protein
MSQSDYFRGVETTTARNHDGALVGYYRGTPVAQQLGNVITLNTGGWRTRTTKVRMNQFANNFVDRSFSVFQLKGSWFVIIRKEGKLLPFFDQSITFEV